METNNIELLEAYLKGSLTKEQQTQVELRLNTDAVFKEDYEMYRLMLSAITENRKTELKTFISRNVKVKPAPFFRTTTFYTAAAASVVLCLISYFVVYKRLAEQNSLAQTETKEAKSEAAIIAHEDTITTLSNKETAQYKVDYTVESSKPDNSEQGLKIAALSEKDQLENRNGGNATRVMDDVSASPEDIKVESDMMLLDTFLFIPRKIYIAKPKQYQNTPNDIYALITTGDKLKLEVQFWRSPINYVGYKLDKNVLAIYGNFDASLASFQELRDTVYLKYKNDYYEISPSETFRGMKKELDSKIIADLDVIEKK